MCCLFGLVDYGKSLSVSQKEHILSVLSKECEERGTDATGIAYNGSGRLHIYKRPLPAHKMKFRVLEDTNIVMGHTRMTTQGSEKHNRNNHPFAGMVSDIAFALAHNGILYNDSELQIERHLPKTDIETDSYVAVQLLEQEKQLSFDSLRNMAELLEGTFTITVLDNRDNLYFIRGSNPMCICHWEDKGLYLYASTEDILKRAVKKLHLDLSKAKQIPLEQGEILKIDRYGKRSYSEFTMRRPYYPYYYDLWNPHLASFHARVERSYVNELKSIACMFGYSAEDVDALIDEGITPEEIEEYLYSVTSDFEW